MPQRHVLFLFGSQMCVAEDPLIAAKKLDCRTSVLTHEIPCGLSPGLIDHIERVSIHAPDEIVRASQNIDQANKIHAVVAYDDQAVPAAARVGAALGLRGNPVHAADAVRDKIVMKQRFAAAGIPMSEYCLATDEDNAVAWAEGGGYPVVVKPVRGSASQGVIRADCERELRTAFRRSLRIVERYGINVGSNYETALLVEAYMPGKEISVELFIVEGVPHVMCIFDKPQPLHGPFFEETIYVTPDSLSPNLRTEICRLAIRAAEAVGLTNGPAHCEIRLTPDGPRVLEIAGRLIGGACSRVFRYALGEDIHYAVLKCALGESFAIPSQSSGSAAGAMMLPIPSEGRLRAIEGLDSAKKLQGVRDVIISVEPGQPIIPFPEQSCYIGFVTATGKTARDVESTLCRAGGILHVDVEPLVCETWTRELGKVASYSAPPEFEIEDLSAHTASDAQEIVLPILARAVFGEFPPELSEAKARDCIRALLAGEAGETAPAMWLISKNQGLALGTWSGDICSIGCLGVIPRFRRTGIAEALVRSLMGRFASHGHARMVVTVDPRDFGAVATYRSLDFIADAYLGQVHCCS